MTDRAGWLSGPTSRPASKWLVGFEILACCGFLLALDLSIGIPLWLRSAGWAAYALVLVGGSIHLVVRYLVKGPQKGTAQNFGQLALCPASWRRWLLDEPRDNSKV
jgi:hypothetical protein